MCEASPEGGLALRAILLALSLHINVVLSQLSHSIDGLILLIRCCFIFRRCLLDTTYTPHLSIKLTWDLCEKVEYRIILWYSFLQYFIRQVSGWTIKITFWIQLNYFQVIAQEILILSV